MSAPAVSPEGSTHGHVVLHWLAATPLDEAALRERVGRELGTTARFHTCDTTGLTLDALIALLAERGKIVRDGAGWRSEMDKVCKDD
jgi:probable metal-binding protein